MSHCVHLESMEPGREGGCYLRPKLIFVTAQQQLGALELYTPETQTGYIYTLIYMRDVVSQCTQ